MADPTIGDVAISVAELHIITEQTLVAVRDIKDAQKEQAYKQDDHSERIVVLETTLDAKLGDRVTRLEEVVKPLAKAWYGVAFIVTSSVVVAVVALVIN